MKAYLKSITVYGILAAGALLAGCAGTSGMPAGATTESTKARLGPPTAEYSMPGGGRRLQYSQMPAGSAVWNLDFDNGGRLRSQDQALRYENFNRIAVGQTTADDIRQMFGPPMRITRVASFDGPVWDYRFNDLNNFRFIHVHIDNGGTVRKIQYTDDVRSRPFGPD
jgi:hypothetical protein